MKSVLLAVSGGIDSMYMAYRASELFPEARRFAVAHCNFRLRGEESDGDEEFVRAWCAERGMKFYSKSFDTAACAGQEGISIEMAARKLRYEWFASLRSGEGFDTVAVAHNADDNAETLILNLLRGTGIRGIRGMGDREGISRPLLRTSRSEIRAWMTGRGYAWREDRTNADSSYKRNLIRNKVFPLFAEINPSFVRTLNSDMRRFGLAGDIAEEYFRKAASSVVLEDGSLSIPELMGLKHWEFVLWHLLEDSGIGQEEFRSLTSALSSGRQLAGKRFGPVTGASGRLVPGDRREKTGRKLEWETVARSCVSSLKQGQGVLIADADRMPVPPVVRKWQPGDWMRPLGMTGRKKVSDILTEMHLSLDEKEDIEVAVLEGSHVAAVLCSRIDGSVRVRPDTETVLRMKYAEDGEEAC